MRKLYQAQVRENIKFLFLTHNGQNMHQYGVEKRQQPQRNRYQFRQKRDMARKVMHVTG
jgi:hypothetical protein